MFLRIVASCARQASPRRAAVPDRVSFGETAFNRLRVGVLQQSAPAGPLMSEARLVYDFGLKDITKKGTCDALLVYQSSATASSEAPFYDKIFLAGNGLNEVVTDLGRSHLLLSTNPLGGWVPGSVPL